MLKPAHSGRTPSGTISGSTPSPKATVAVLLPCFNEEITIASVVKEFREALPEASIYVFDNNSKDRTAERAREAGAVVVPSRQQGKGNVVRHMFDAIDADIYVMADGDGTYPARFAPALIEAIAAGADMAIGTRLKAFQTRSFRRFHQFGNHLITGAIRWLGGVQVTDVLSGYRAFSRELVKSLPLLSEGFEIETELTLQAVVKRFRIQEMPIEYGERPEGSVSKLSTWSDGWIILRFILFVIRDFRPLLFFGGLGAALAVLSLALGWIPVSDYLETRFVSHVPMAILAAAVGLLAALCVAIGLVLDSAHRYHNENFLLWRRSLRAGAGREA